MNTQEILNFELDNFKKNQKKIDFTKQDKVNTSIALSKALTDALSQGARRLKTDYKSIKDNLLEAFIPYYLDFSFKEKNIEKSAFNDEFNKLISQFIDIMKKSKKKEFATFGFAQKFVSMSFKYMYCFDDSKRGNFKFCKLPLDKYTISWYRQNGDKELIKQFKEKKFAWSEIPKFLYNEIQDDIDSILCTKCKYQIKCSDKTAVIVLPENKIEVEFIVWSQEKLNEVYREIIKYKDYWGRLGINKN